MIRSEIRFTMHDAVVTEVDKTKFTFDCKVLETEYTDVPLGVLKTEQASFVNFPKVGSDCVIAFRELNQARPQLISFQEIEESQINIDGTTIVINKDGIVFNDGKLGGMVKINDLVSWLSKVSSDLTKLQSLLATHPVAGNGAPLALTFIPTATTPTASMFENKKIKQ